MKQVIYICALLLVCLQVAAQQAADTTQAVAAEHEDTTAVQVTRLRINSTGSDFSPYVLNDQLLFVSGRARDLGVQYVDVNNESEITDLYTCRIVSPGKFRGVNPLSDVINTKYYEGPFCFNKEGTVMYYTANDKRSSLLKIFWSEKVNGAWSNPEPMYFCEEGISYCHPALSPNGNFMIFSASNAKEKKGMDLYRVDYVNNVWTEAVPLPASVNDSSNQVFPFISSANILFFSSNKKGGMGGLDVYRVPLDSLAKVRALPHPVNSAADDFGVWVDSTGEAGYFSSNRAPRTKDDIYYFANSIPDFSEAKTVVTKTKFCYSFFEESTLESKDTINLTYEWNFGDGVKGRGLKTRHCFPGPGEYQVQLNIVDKESGAIFTSEAAYPLVVDWPDQLVISCNEQAAPGEEMSLSTVNCLLKDYELSKVYWSFGDGKYTSGPTVKHVYRKPGVYTVEAGIVAKHTLTGKTEQFKTEKKIEVKNPAYEK